MGMYNGSRRQLLEVASWDIATALIRRHSDLIIRREHPGDGQYDCLAIRSESGLLIFLNRVGNIQVHVLEGGRAVPSPQVTEWDGFLNADDTRQFIRRLERTAGLPDVEGATSSTARVLAYRILGALPRIQLFHEDIQPMGAIDSSGYDGGPAEWPEGFPSIMSRLREDRADPFDFWHVSGRAFEIAVAVPDGIVWSRQGTSLNLMGEYDRVQRSFTRLLALVLGITG